MPKEREAGICVPEAGGGERDTCREGQRQRSGQPGSHIEGQRTGQVGTVREKPWEAEASLLLHRENEGSPETTHHSPGRPPPVLFSPAPARMLPLPPNS